MRAYKLHIHGRLEWPSGPWNDEPDKVQWQDEATGMACLIVRNALGGLCGYVGVTKDHLLYNKPYHHGDCKDIFVHGGLTYSDKCDGNKICHIVGPNEEDDVWWLGFDCVHGGDLAPGMLQIAGWSDGIYRNLSTVALWVTNLAEQLNNIQENRNAS